MLAARVMDPCVAQPYFVCVEMRPGRLSLVEPPLCAGFAACVGKPYVFSGTRAAGWAFARSAH